MEATESPETVMKYYDELLDTDSANAVGPESLKTVVVFPLSTQLQAVWKRQISILRRIGKVDQAVDELSRFLDTFYNDVEGWLELADIYTSCNQ
jgi:hypothetical protein